MKGRWVLPIGIFFLMAGAGSSLRAQPFSTPASAPQESSPSTSSESPPFGTVLFFLEPKEKGTGSLLGSVHVGEDDQVYFCLKLNPQDPRLTRPVRYLRAVEVTLEGEGDSPQKIKGMTKIRKRVIEPESDGCYVGRMKIPAGIPPGKYQVAELDLWLTNGREVSLRDELEEFSSRGVVEIESPQLDSTPPVVEKIESKTPLVDRFNFGGKTGRADILFRVVAYDAVSGIDPNSFHIFFKVFLDDHLVDILEPRCRTQLPNLYYDCKLYFSRAAPHLRARTAKIILDSVSVSDRLGNSLEINDPAELRSLFEGKNLRYTFYSHRPPGEAGPPENENQNNEEMLAWPPGTASEQTQGK
jgi:hypothetical protein